MLVHVFPDADVPVVQLSIDETQPAAFHYELGRRLAPLRDEGVLVMGSGNLVHNLHAYAWGRHPAEPFDWALRFETRGARADRAPASTARSSPTRAWAATRTSRRRRPSTTCRCSTSWALRRPDDAVTFPVEGIDGGSVSMLTVRIG